MHSTTFTASVLATAALISTTFASPILETRTVARRGFTPPQLVSYWGNGNDQIRLGDFCANTTLDVIPVGFVNSFPDEEGNNGYPGTNYANACGSAFWVAPDGTQTKMFTSCWQIEEDIPKCQALGKKILASLGGASPGTKITSKDSAKKFAQFLWGSFGPLQDPDLIQFPRPFGKSVVVDGFDLDIEHNGGFGYADLVNELRAISGPKKLIISAAPQCFTDDPQLSDAIQNSIIDYVWVQYYNSDPCSAASLFSTGTLKKNTDVSFGWVDWLKTNSKNKNVQLFLGLPASPAAANPGFYLDLAKTTALLEEFSCNPKYQGIFGGIMLWEATESARNTQSNGLPFADNVKAAFGKLSCIPVVTTTTTTTTTSTTTTTTSPAAPPTSTTTTTTSPATTTTTYDFPHGPHPSSTTSEAQPTTSVSTTTSAFPHGPLPTTTSEAPVVTTTTSEFPHGPHPTTTSAVGVIPTTTSDIPHGPRPTTTSEAPVVTTTTSDFPHGPRPTTSSAAPASTTTSSFSRPHGPGGETSSTTTSPVVGPVTTSSSTKNEWEDWGSSSLSPVVDPTFTTTKHWTTTSKPVDPVKTTSTSTIDEPWLDWTTTRPVDPVKTTSITVAPVTTKPHHPTVTTTIWTTIYTDWDHTTFVTRTFTATTTLTVYPGTTAAPWVWPVDSNGCPHGFTTSVVTIENPPVTTTITLTVPVPSAPAPHVVKPTTSAPANPFVFGPSGTAVAPVASSSVVPPSPASTSVTPVKPANVATFTGAAAAQAQLPGTVMSVAVCLAVAVAGLLV